MNIPRAPPLVSNVEVSVRCENLRDEDLLSKSDPTCVLFSKDNKSSLWIEFGRTEKIQESLNPRWTKKFLLPYRFEERQMFKLEVYDIDSSSGSLADHDPLGSVECSLGEIMAEQRRGFSRAFAHGGEIFVYAEEVANHNDLLTFSLEGKNLDKKDFFGKSDPFFEISRVNLESSDWSLVYRSEVINNDLSPRWAPVQLDTVTLCNSDHDRSLRVDVYDHDSDGSHDLIGRFTTTLRRLLLGPGSENEYECINEKKKKKSSKYSHSGLVCLTKIGLEKVHSFLDYISGGLQLNFTTAIDFTGSNGHPSDPASLHYNGPGGRPNQYVTAIQAVGEIVQDYDSDKMFPALGFGARIPPNGKVSHEFFLSLDERNPYCAGLDGVMAAYNNSLHNVQLYGPTNFAPVIRHVSKFAHVYQNDPSNYFVLLIITDGIITDLAETKKAIIQASVLPLSIIIVGVGDEDFQAMEELDSDDHLLRQDNLVASRDIVQFVELRQFIQRNGTWSKEQLGREVLAEIPAQLLSFMKSKQFPPPDLSNTQAASAPSF